MKNEGEKQAQPGPSLEEFNIKSLAEYLLSILCVQSLNVTQWSILSQVFCVFAI